MLRTVAIIFVISIFTTGCGLQNIGEIVAQKRASEWAENSIREAPISKPQALSSSDEVLQKRITVVRLQISAEMRDQNEANRELAMLREVLIGRNPKWSKNAKELIRKGRAEEKMTMDQVKAALGKPTFINLPQDANKLREQLSSNPYVKSGDVEAHVASVRKSESWSYSGSYGGYDYNFGTVSFYDGLVIGAASFVVDADK